MLRLRLTEAMGVTHRVPVSPYVYEPSSPERGSHSPGVVGDKSEGREAMSEPAYMSQGRLSRVLDRGQADFRESSFHALR